MKQRQIFGTVFALEAVVATGVFVVVLALFGFALIRRRARQRPGETGKPERPRLEVFYVSVLTAFVAFLVAWTAWQNHRENDAADPAPVRVDVLAHQWCWTFGYPQTSHHRGVTSLCRGDQLPTLVVPTGRPVQLRLTSRDVIHSLWVPHLRYKMDVFPHHVNTFTLTFDHEGRWMGKCAEFCGQRHATMRFWLKAVSPGEYDRWAGAQQGTGGGAAV
ncbi:cytochrome c oxidase subunit II [Streptomyces sp. NK08204]|uniref:cytochrome c oxidase subunit II n=1 Tax=Streptomyces sp. NK08204 TaxID=2873260 RepID=UPI001CEDEA07|nr:cytochrome c oxidase subunit II [Streptomyces sp. NK08204]